MDYIAKNLSQFQKKAEYIASKAKVGDIYALYGDLGAGKTTFVKYFAQKIGIKTNVTSPTFILEKRYNIGIFKGKNTQLIHLDCYRVDRNNIDKWYFYELFDCSDNIVMIEWPEKIANLLPKNVKKIYFEYIDQNIRKISY